jgi:hypothetical protein
VWGGEVGGVGGEETPTLKHRNKKNEKKRRGGAEGEKQKGWGMGTAVENNRQNQTKKNSKKNNKKN